MSNRKEGYYWVYDQNEWGIAEWTQGYWWFHGHECGFEDEHFKMEFEVGEIIVKDDSKYKEINEGLKSFPTNIREDAIGLLLDGICIHCSEVVEGQCHCMNDD